MTDDATTIALLLDHVAELTALLRAHQTHLLTIEAYLRDQPGYNQALMVNLFVNFRDRTDATLRAQQTSQLRGLKDLLADFEGPEH